jgi:hypothetical protein
MKAETWRDEIERFRTAAESISDELLVVLVGDVITEAALPSYLRAFVHDMPVNMSSMMSVE